MKKFGIDFKYVDSSPNKLYLELTNGCNLNCTICYRHGWTQGEADQELNLEDLKNIHSQLEGTEVKEIVLGGIGEPTYSKLFSEAVEIFKDYNLTLTTNGTLISENITSIGKGINKVIISVDGDEEEFFSIRQTQLKDVKDGIKSIKKANEEINVYLQFVMCKSNKEKMLYVIDMANELNLQGVIYSNLIPQTEESKDDILYTIDSNPKMDKEFNLVRNYALRRGITVVFPKNQLKTTRRCQFIEQGATYINSLCDVVPCYRFAHDSVEYVYGRRKAIQSHSFGNIRDEKLMDIWNNEEYKRYRKTLCTQDYPSCIDCELVDGCDMVTNTTWDCEGMSPTCGDCLWARRLVICP